jgi:hypothetical protein
MNRESSLEERVERLEHMVAEIHASLGTAAERPAASAPAAPVPPASHPSAHRTPAAPDPRRAEAWAHFSEQWLGRVGLGLLFLGLVYLFNYSIEQGWITPAVRVGVGLAIGSLLLALGLRLRENRRSYSHLLLAGAVAVYYVTGFAANQLYLLVSYGAALAYMTGVMVLAFALARRQDHPSLASLGALGGLVTPLLLHRESAAVLELCVYGALVVGWAGLLYWLRGWPSLLWTYAVGGLATLGIAASHAAGDQRWAVEAALLLTWALGAALPFVRGRLKADRRGQRFWGIVPLGLQLRVLGVGITSGVIVLTETMWTMSDAASGALFLVAAALFGMFAWVGTRTPNRVARAAAPVAAALCATGTFLALGQEPARVAVLSAEALLFVYAGHIRRLAGVEWVGHTLFAALVIAFLGESYQARTIAFDLLSFTQLAMILMIVAASFWRSAPRTGLLPAHRFTPWVYRLAAHALFMLWLSRELSPLSSGTGAVTLAWGVYGAILLLFALRMRPGPTMIALQLVAFSALALAVIKLIAVDLTRIAMVWRILLFMGFGGAFLALSSRFKPRGENPDVSA